MREAAQCFDPLNPSSVSVAALCGTVEGDELDERTVRKVVDQGWLLWMTRSVSLSCVCPVCEDGGVL